MHANTAHNTVSFRFCFLTFFFSVTHPFQWTVTQWINVLLKQWCTVYHSSDEQDSGFMQDEKAE